MVLIFEGDVVVAPLMLSFFRRAETRRRTVASLIESSCVVASSECSQSPLRFNISTYSSISEYRRIPQTYPPTFHAVFNAAVAMMPYFAFLPRFFFGLFSPYKRNAGEKRSMASWQPQH